MPDSASETIDGTSGSPRDLRDVVLDSTGEGIVVADERGKFLIWNRAATELLGLGATQLPPEEWPAHYRLSTPDDDELIASDRLPLVRAIQGEVVDDFDLISRNVRTGRATWLSCYARPLRDDDGKIIGGVVVFRDVTERRRMEKELESFARTISHDLKDPLTGISGLLEVLRSDHASRLDESGREYLEQIARCAERMGRLIDDLLDHCRIGTGWKAMTSVDLGRVIDNAVGGLAAEIQRTGAVVRVHRPLPAVCGHAHGLEQAVRNLLANALKFVAPGQRPEVDVGCSEDESSWRIYVRDRGIGIEPKYHRAIFEVFRRLHARERYEGTGIGLALVKKIADLHQGSVQVESAPGQGSTFWLILPKRAPSAPVAKEAVR